MSQPVDRPDPLVEVLGEIRDVLREIRDAVRPREIRMAEAMRPISVAPPKPAPRPHIG